MEGHKLVLTKNSLIAQAKQSVPLFGDESIPGVKICFDKFALKIGLVTKADFDDDPWDAISNSWKTWMHDRDYDAKKNIFRKLGFDVVGLFIDCGKFSDFDQRNHWSEDFLIQQKDLLIVDIRNNVDTYANMDEDVIFVLQYHAKNRGELAQAMVDYEKVAADREMSRSLDKVFGQPIQTTRVDKYLEEHGSHVQNDEAE